MVRAQAKQAVGLAFSVFQIIKRNFSDVIGYLKNLMKHLIDHQNVLKWGEIEELFSGARLMVQAQAKQAVGLALSVFKINKRNVSDVICHFKKWWNATMTISMC